MDNFSLMLYSGNVVKVCALLLLIPLVRWVSNGARRVCAERFSPAMGVFVRQLIFYGGLIAIGVFILRECGFTAVELSEATEVLVARRYFY